jgi:hypothetical protein
MSEKQATPKVTRKRMKPGAAKTDTRATSTATKATKATKATSIGTKATKATSTATKAIKASEEASMSTLAKVAPKAKAVSEDKAPPKAEAPPKAKAPLDAKGPPTATKATSVKAKATRAMPPKATKATKGKAAQEEEKADAAEVPTKGTPTILTPRGKKSGLKKEKKETAQASEVEQVMKEEVVEDQREGQGGEKQRVERKRMTFKSVSVQHEIAVREFEGILIRHICANGLPIDSLIPIGNAQYPGSSGNRSKRPDKGYLQRDTRDSEDVPSFVVEVGVSESLNGLRNDAHFWLTQTGGGTRLVLLIKVKKGDQVIEMERWEHVPSTRPRRKYSPAYHPQCQQRLVLNGANGNVENSRGVDD